ncbi:uncharacterized protein redic1 [Symphorus nematophorus]
MKNDAKRQREFFEKRKMQNRLKNLGIALSASPGGTSSASMDLVTLFIVNQIAAKKENKDPPKVGVLGSRKGGSKHNRNEPLVLPMSPCSPSQLSFLSPVQESAFSDNSASDYLPPITDPLSPFSSASSASSGQMNLQQGRQTQAQPPPHCSPPPWGTSGLEQTKLSNCTDINFSCLEHNSGPVNGCDCSPSCSCSRGYLSSDSDDEEEAVDRQPCLQTAPSYMDQGYCADSLNPNLGLQRNPKQRHTQPMLLTPLPKTKTNFRDDKKVMEKEAHPDKALGSNTAQFDSPKTQSSEPCKCKKRPNETRDAGTQTVDNPTVETCDASTQCSFVINSAAKTSVLSLCLPPVDVSVQHPATGRQTDTAAEPNTHTPSPGQTRSRGRHTPWSKKKSHALSGSKVILQGPINPFLAERGQQENGRLMKVLSTEVREEVTSASGVSGHSEEAKTLQEIADILLLLKQREK